MSEQKVTKGHLGKGTEAEWYQPQDLSAEKREEFRKRSQKSQLAALAARRGDGPKSIHPLYEPRFDPATVMPRKRRNGLRALSLFSGGGGLDLGFDLAGFKHIASYELLEFAAATLKKNRPRWAVYGGDEGDVTEVDWTKYRGEIDVIHGGPPCQPFSSAGRRKGSDDARDMFPEFVRAVLEIEPAGFIAENVRGLDTKKFEPYINKTIREPLEEKYSIISFHLDAAAFGVPQKRTRVVFIGLHREKVGRKPAIPEPTHDWSRFDKSNKVPEEQLDLIDSPKLPATMGAREALGLPDIGIDALSPTLRCSLTGPRGTTSILSSTAAQKIWFDLELWPNGVAANKEAAKAFPAKHDYYRLSTLECGLMQGFPEDWVFEGAVHKVLGQIGNSVAPPMAYGLATSLAKDILGSG